MNRQPLGRTGMEITAVGPAAGARDAHRRSLGYSSTCAPRVGYALAGVSNFATAELDAAEKIGHVDTLQPPLSLLRRDAAGAGTGPRHPRRREVQAP